MEILEAIRTRRSVREFTGEPVNDDELGEILAAGAWAPSGLNNQPWRFGVVRDRQKREELARLTKYGRVVRTADLVIPVFLDRREMYSDLKDHQGAGACIQNMLLAAHGLGLGAVWLGEILRSEREVRELFPLPDDYLLMAVIAVGRPVCRERSSSRKPLQELMLFSV